MTMAYEGIEPPAAYPSLSSEPYARHGRAASFRLSRKSVSNGVRTYELLALVGVVSISLGGGGGGEAAIYNSPSN